MGRSAPYVMDEVSENGSEGVKGNASDGRKGEEYRVRLGRGRGAAAAATGGLLWLRLPFYNSRLMSESFKVAFHDGRGGLRVKAK